MENINLDLDSGTDTKKIKEIIISREQYYLNLFLPSLNVNKTAGSMLGFNHNEETRMEFSIFWRGKPLDPYNLEAKNSLSETINPKTISKLKQRTKGVMIKVFDKDSNLINEFPTIKETVKFYGISYSIISNYAKTDKLWDNKFLFKMEFKLIESKVLKVSKPLFLEKSKFYRKGYLVEVRDKDNELVYQFLTVRGIVSFFNISHTTVLRYIKIGKLWNNLYTFKVCIGIPFLPISFTSISIPNLSLDKPLIKNNIKMSPIEVYSPEGNLIYQFNFVSRTAETLDLSRSTIRYNADKGNLWRGKYFF